MTGDHNPENVKLLNAALATPDFIERLFDDDVSLDWGLTLEIGKLLIDPTVRFDLGYFYVARAARHLGERSTAVDALLKLEQALFSPGTPLEDAQYFAQAIEYERFLLSQTDFATGSELDGRPSVSSEDEEDDTG